VVMSNGSFDGIHEKLLRVLDHSLNRASGV
jgi:hypothetical protein